MAILNFSLNEEGVASLRDALICLNKFSDDVSLEARKDSVSPLIMPRSGNIILIHWVIVYTEHVEQLQVCVRELQVRNQQVLLSLQVPSYGPAPGKILLHIVHKGKHYLSCFATSLFSPGYSRL